MKEPRTPITLMCLLSFAAGCSAADGGADVSTLSRALSVKKGWHMASHDEVASGHNSSERRIRRDTVADVNVAWTFDAQTAGFPVGPVHANPVVGGNKVYFGTGFGQFFALNRDGEMLWAYQTRAPNPLLGAVFGAQNTPVVGAAVLPRTTPLVIFGDLDGNIYALDRATGEEVWVKAANPHPLGGIVGNSLLLVDDTVVIGMSSVENAALGIPDYRCCSHRGAVIALDVATGEQKWRYDTIDSAQPLNGAFGSLFELGPSGADVWGQPTFDRESNTVFFGTGQNFSPKLSATPPFSTDTSDAIIAVDATTGQEKWKTQFTPGDIWVNGIPNPNLVDPDTGLPEVPFARAGFLDLDVGDSPKVYDLPDGTRVVGAGQKNGEYHVLDATTGDVIESTPIVQYANNLGGFQAGGAFAGDTVFQHGLDGFDPTTTTGPYFGTVMGLSLDGTEVKWRFDKFLSPLAGSLSTAAGVVYVVSPSEERAALDPSLPPEWAIYGLDAESGDVLMRRAFPGRSLTGPVIDNGQVYVGMGNTAVPEIGMDFNGGLVALAPPDEE